MPTININVQKALQSQETLVNQSEHCSADSRMLAKIGRALGQQIRVKRSDDEYALFTVSEVRKERSHAVVRMASVARARLTSSANIPDQFAAVADSQVPHPTLSDECAETQSEFVKRLTDNGTHSGLVAIAPHGGAIESQTDLQAERLTAQLADKGVSCWRCKGWKQGGGAFTRWHITSSELHEASFPRLNTIIQRSFSFAVAFHGFEQEGILIGGGADALLKCQVKSVLDLVLDGRDIPVKIATAEDHFNGDHPHNIVNRLANGNGLQIEQSFHAREQHWQLIADAVASVFRCRV